MEWLRLLGSLKLQVSFAKEPYKRDDILQKRPIILRSLLPVATPFQIQTHLVDRIVGGNVSFDILGHFELHGGDIAQFDALEVATADVCVCACVCVYVCVCARVCV